jgi:hypothetical protein
MQALSQLSYGPMEGRGLYGTSPIVSSQRVGPSNSLASHRMPRAASGLLTTKPGMPNADRKVPSPCKSLRQTFLRLVTVWRQCPRPSYATHSHLVDLFHRPIICTVRSLLKANPPQGGDAKLPVPGATPADSGVASGDTRRSLLRPRAVPDCTYPASHRSSQRSATRPRRDQFAVLFTGR